jgi:aminocarboxymuconate-semialdehyde decarboxylase
MTKNIDVHWHHVPKPFVKAVADGKVPLKGRYQLDENGEPEIKVDLGFREFTQELPPELSEVDAAIEHMDRVGLDVVAASVAPPLMQYLASAEDGLKISQVLNDSMAEVTSAHPERFAPLANVPLQAPEAAAKELRRAVTELGFAGAQISTQVDGQNLGDKDLRPFWEAVAELDAFIFLHPSPPPLGLREGRINRHDMGNFVGLPIESACALASLMFDGVYEDVGTIKTCFAHGGGAFPYILSRWEHGYGARLAPENPPMKNPYSYMDSVYADSLTHSPRALQFLVDTIGEDHVMLGSDYPFDMGVEDPVGAMHEAIEAGPVRDKIAGLNAEKLLNIRS